MSQPLFEDVLAKERRRADRSDRPLSLLQVAAFGTAPIPPFRWDEVIPAVAGAKRSTDVLGWIQPQVALGVILAETQCANLALAAQLERRVRNELKRRVDRATAENLSIRLHVYPDAGLANSSEVGPVGPIHSLLPLLEDIRSRRDHAPVYEVVKRVADIVGSVTLLTALSPLLLLIAGAVKLGARGPILFKQTRVGQGMRPFTMLKFRTMQANADHVIHQAYVSSFINDNAASAGRETTATYKISDDPRVTRLGRLLRRTSTDELPQLWNVLRGDMSLVGPRPPLPYEVKHYKSWHHRRVLEAKPGLTGLWQVMGRSRTTFDEMVRLDLRYVRTRSLWTDLKILLATPRAVIAGKGAY